MQKKRRMLWVLFGLYAAVMLVLLFNRTPHDNGLGYWQQMAANLNLVPFRTIREFIDLLVYRRNSNLISHAVINLFGNIAVFVPLGVFLPALRPRLRSWKAAMLCSAAIITCIELTQLFTLRGSCDIDDLILNLLGIAIGFAFWRIWRRIHHEN